MDSLSKLTASGVSFEFEGNRYEISPLSLIDLSRIKQFVREFIMQDAKKMAALMTEAGAPAEHITELWKEALAAAKKPLQSGFVQEPECLEEFFLLSLQRKNPDINSGTVKKMLSDPDILNQMIKTTKDLNEDEVEVKKT